MAVCFPDQFEYTAVSLTPAGFMRNAEFGMRNVTGSVVDATSFRLKFHIPHFAFRIGVVSSTRHAPRHPDRHPGPRRRTARGARSLTVPPPQPLVHAVH